MGSAAAELYPLGLMTLQEFDHQVLSRIVAKVAGYSRLDIYHAYHDGLLLGHEIDRLERQRPVDVVFSNAATDAERMAAIQKQGLTQVLLKALYMVADIFICRFIGGLHGQESMSMNSFLIDGDPKFGALGMDLTPAYCVTTYRNKLVAHYDVKRMGGYGANATGVVTLVPLPESFHIGLDDVATLKSLRAKYQSENTHLRSIENHFELLSSLFYAIPAGEVRRKNPDRDLINRIAEKGGCTSNSASEIIEALDRLSVGVLRCL